MTTRRVAEPRRGTARLVAAVAALAAVMVAAVPGHAGPEVYTGGDAGQTAFAAWGVPSGDRRFPMNLTVVQVYRGVVPDGFGTYAFVGTLRCQMPRARGWNPIGCRGRGEILELAFEDFSMDPMMVSASARIPDGNRVHRVEWQGAGAGPTPYVFPAVWPPQQHQFVNAHLWGITSRDGVASGRVLGRSFSSGHRNAGASLHEGTFRWVSLYPWLESKSRAGEPVGWGAFFSRNSPN